MALEGLQADTVNAFQEKEIQRGLKVEEALEEANASLTRELTFAKIDLKGCEEQRQNDKGLIKIEKKGKRRWAGAFFILLGCVVTYEVVESRLYR